MRSTEKGRDSETNVPPTPPSFVDNAVQIGGSGHFAALPGVGTRQLAVLRLETLSECKLVPRR